MTSRVPRHVAKELIQYVKGVSVRANFWDPRAKSAFEFSRQMSSPKLKKINTSFACTLDMQTTDQAEDPVVEVDFLDGSKLSINCLDKTCADLRSQVFTRASEAEENVEAKAGGGASKDAASKGAAAKGGAAKGGGKK